MRSSDSPDVLALDRDLPTTAEDVAALARLWRAEELGLEEYLRFLDGFPAPAPATLRARQGPSGPPFDLVR